MPGSEDDFGGGNVAASIGQYGIRIVISIPDYKQE
jgi:hypothetical protein